MFVNYGKFVPIKYMANFCQLNLLQMLQIRQIFANYGKFVPIKFMGDLSELWQIFANYGKFLPIMANVCQLW